MSAVEKLYSRYYVWHSKTSKKNKKSSVPSCSDDWHSLFFFLFLLVRPPDITTFIHIHLEFAVTRSLRVYPFSQHLKLLPHCYFCGWEWLLFFFFQMFCYASRRDSYASLHAGHNHLLAVNQRLCSSQVRTITLIVGKKKKLVQMSHYCTQTSYGDVHSANVRMCVCVFFFFLFTVLPRTKMACWHVLGVKESAGQVLGRWWPCAEECMLAGGFNLLHKQWAWLTGNRQCKEQSRCSYKYKQCAVKPPAHPLTAA